MPETPASAPSAHRLDPAAVRRSQLRLLSAAEPPWLHQEAARRMADRLAFIRQPPQRVLDWSLEGGLDVAPALRAACPGARLQRLRPDAPEGAAPSWWSRWLGRVRPRGAADVPLQALAEGGADLLWSGMLLHREEDPPALLARWRQALAAEGFVMFTTLGPGTLAPLRALYARMGWPEPFAPFVDMHDLGDMMVAAGFADPVMDQDVLYLTYRSPKDLLDELRTLGGNLSPLRGTGLRTPRWRARLLSELEKLAGPDGRIEMPFELVHGHAFRAPDRGPAVAAETRIGVEDMKLMLRKPPRADTCA